MLLRDGDWVTFPQSMRAALGTCVRRVWASCKWFPLGVTSSGKSGEEKPGLFVCFRFLFVAFVLVLLASAYSDMVLRARSWLSGSGLSEKEGQGSMLQQRMVRGKTLELGHQEGRCLGSVT